MESISLKKVKIIARSRIFTDANRYNVLDDLGLKALDGYYAESIDVEDNDNLISIAEKFEKEHPELSGWNIQIEELK